MQMHMRMHRSSFPISDLIRLSRERRDLQTEPSQLAEKAATLRAIYEPRYAFPEWTVQELGKGNLMSHAETAAWPGRHGVELGTGSDKK